MLVPQVVVELSRLFSLEVDAIHAYESAATLAGSGPVEAELRLFGLEHQRHALVLQDVIIRLGHHPPEVVPDVKGVVIGALTAPSRPLTIEDVLEGMRGNEQLTNSVYAKVLAKPVPPGVRQILSPLLEDERRHLERMERMISRRIWESGWASP